MSNPFLCSFLPRFYCTILKMLMKTPKQIKFGISLAALFCLLIIGSYGIVRTVIALHIPLGVSYIVTILFASVLAFLSACFVIRTYRSVMQRSEQQEMSEKKYKDLFDSTTDGVFEVSADGTVTLINQSGAKILGYETPAEMIGRNILDHWRDPKDREAYKAEIETNKSVSAYPIEAKKKNGESVELEVSSRLIMDEGGKFLGIEGIMRDVTKRKRMEEDLRSMSQTDALTGLYNRRGFVILAEHLLKMTDRLKRGIYMLYADLDNLKMINDTFGHMEGDQALIDTARILEVTYRNSDVIARIGGDEFVVIPVGFGGDNVELIQDRLQKSIDAHNAKKDGMYDLSLSTGIAYYDFENPCSLHDLLLQCDKCMYEAKKQKKEKLGTHPPGKDGMHP